MATTYRTSRKMCNEMAELLASLSEKRCTFYAKDEYKLNDKVYVRFDEEVLEFKTQTAAHEWMLDEAAKYLEF